MEADNDDAATSSGQRPLLAEKAEESSAQGYISHDDSLISNDNGNDQQTDGESSAEAAHSTDDEGSSTCSTDTTKTPSSSQPADVKGDDWPLSDGDDDSSESSSSSTDAHIPNTEIVVVDPTLQKSVQFYQILESAYRTANLHHRAKQATYRSSADYERPKNTNMNGTDPPYEIKIRGEMLGLTVENILENTYIRTVVPSGMAAPAGAKVGCVISQIGMYFCRLSGFSSKDVAFLCTIRVEMFAHVFSWSFT